jgi:hypothetical protein
MYRPCLLVRCRATPWASQARILEVLLARPLLLAHTSVHNDRPSTLPIPRGCLLTPGGSGPVVSLHARARRPSRLARGLSTNTCTARTCATGTHPRQHLRARTLSRTRTRARLRRAGTSQPARQPAIPPVTEAGAAGQSGLCCSVHCNTESAPCFTHGTGRSW